MHSAHIHLLDGPLALGGMLDTSISGDNYPTSNYLVDKLHKSYKCGGGSNPNNPTLPKISRLGLCFIGFYWVLLGQNFESTKIIIIFIKIVQEDRSSTFNRY